MVSTPLETMSDDLTTAHRKRVSSGYSFQNFLLSSEPTNEMVAMPGNLKGSKAAREKQNQIILEEEGLVKLKAESLEPAPLPCKRPTRRWTFRAGPVSAWTPGVRGCAARLFTEDSSRHFMGGANTTALPPGFPMHLNVPGRPQTRMLIPEPLCLVCLKPGGHWEQLGLLPDLFSVFSARWC